MAVLKILGFASALAGAALVACYSPDAPDCTLACSEDSDCVGGQSCTSDHMCASPTIGASCSGHLTTDGGMTPDAAGSGSASTVDIRVHIDGQGGVRSSNDDNCDSLIPTTCTFKAPTGQPITLTATPHITKQFDKWQGPPCMDAGNNPCTTSPQMAFDVMPKFKM